MRFDINQEEEERGKTAWVGFDCGIIVLSFNIGCNDASWMNTYVLPVVVCILMKLKTALN